MCGILFYFSKNKSIAFSKFHQSLEQLHHRGPDTTKTFYLKGKRLQPADEFSNSNLFIGHKRLSIIDLTDRSIQPVYNKTRNSVLAYNGEIYNYFNLNNSQNSDTLALEKLLSEKKFTKINDLNGAWAFVYYLINENKILVSKDRYGKKPLFYFKDNKTFIISSEIKPILTLLDLKSYEVDPFALSYFLTTKQTPNFNNGSTFYKNIKSFKPSRLISIDLNDFSFKKILSINNPAASLSEENNKDVLIEEFEQIFDSSVKLRLNSDVPISILASGGLDSSAVIYSALKNKNCSLINCQILNKNKEENDDQYFSKLIADCYGLDLFTVKINKYTDDEYFKDIFYLSEKSILPINFFLASMPTYFISKELNKKGIKVALDGVGGDEIMGGYENFNKLFNASLYNSNIFNALKYLKMWKDYDKNFHKGIIKRLIKGLLLLLKIRKIHQPSDDIFNNLKKAGINKNLLIELDHFNKFYFNRGLIDDMTEMQNFEINKHQIPFYLFTADFFNMINSVENRSPFLDYRLKKFVGIKDKFKFHKNQNKFLLRKYLEKSNLPKEVIFRKNKMGFRNLKEINCYKNKIVDETISSSVFINSIFNSSNFINNVGIDIKRNLFSIAAVDNYIKLK